MTTGVFITLEGPEGAGKSTQSSRLAARLREAGHTVVETREPGGTPEGEALRALLLASDRQWSPIAEALLMSAARDAHLDQVIRPALARGEIVVCDRFMDSTRAYQGGGGGVPGDVIDALETAVCARLPDLTLIFDLPVETGLARAQARGAADRFEDKGLAYHSRVAAAFLALEALDRTALIDANGDVDTVSAQIVDVVRQRLPALL